jgi:cell wall-associated protease
MKRIVCIVLLFTIGIAQAQVPITTGKVIARKKTEPKVRAQWQMLDIQTDTLPGTSLNKAYLELITKKGEPIIVAVIDTSIDIYHEDLKDVIWTNKKEIPNNGIDDDKNGYIDDIHGWNFLGEVSKKNQSSLNSCEIRTLRYLKKKHPQFPNFSGNKSDSLLYVRATENYLKDKKSDSESKYAVEELEKYIAAKPFLKKYFGKDNFTFEEINTLYFKHLKGDKKLVEHLDNMWYYVYSGSDEAVLKTKVLQQENQNKFVNNDSFYDHAGGTDETNLNDIQYGTNDVSATAAWDRHGTEVSGTVGANRKNKKGIKGFSEYISIMPLVAVPKSGDEHEKDVVLAIKYAVDNGAKVINMSFGSDIYLRKEWMKEVFQYAEKKDVLLVNGAGNEKADLDKTAFHPLDYDEGTGEEFCDNFLKIGAITKNCNAEFVASFSNYGKKNVDIFAPGSSIKTTNANVGYCHQQGTSFASPVVAGVAALVRSQYPKLTAAQVKQILLDSSVQYDLQVQVPGQPEGTLKPFKELSKSGGVVNAYNALLMAAEMSKKSGK